MLRKPGQPPHPAPGLCRSPGSGRREGEGGGGGPPGGGRSPPGLPAGPASGQPSRGPARLRPSRVKAGVQFPPSEPVNPRQEQKRRSGFRAPQFFRVNENHQPAGGRKAPAWPRSSGGCGSPGAEASRPSCGAKGRFRSPSPGTSIAGTCPSSGSVSPRAGENRWRGSSPAPGIPCSPGGGGGKRAGITAPLPSHAQGDCRNAGQA